MAEETRTAIYAWALMSNHGHLLLCSGSMGLAKLMRRFLSGYAVSYNLRHRRHGHAFQKPAQIDVSKADTAACGGLQRLKAPAFRDTR